MDNNKWIEVRDSITQSCEQFGIDWILEDRGSSFEDLIEEIMIGLFKVID